MINRAKDELLSATTTDSETRDDQCSCLGLFSSASLRRTSWLALPLPVSALCMAECASRRASKAA